MIIQPNVGRAGPGRLFSSVRELLRGITVTRGAAFVINVAAVYLLLSTHLFGLRGGRAAYQSERRGEQLLEVERSALTAAHPCGASVLAAAGTRGSDPRPGDRNGAEDRP
jgi:hypothetical protein